MAEGLIAERLEALITQRGQLQRRIEDLEGRLAASAGDLPSEEYIAELAGKVAKALADVTVTPAKKALLATLVDHVAVQPGRALYPCFKVPGLPAVLDEGGEERQCAQSALDGTAVRAGEPTVEVTSIVQRIRASGHAKFPVAKPAYGGAMAAAFSISGTASKPSPMIRPDRASKERRPPRRTSRRRGRRRAGRGDSRWMGRGVARGGRITAELDQGAAT